MRLVWVGGGLANGASHLGITSVTRALYVLLAETGLSENTHTHSGYSKLSAQTSTAFVGRRYRPQWPVTTANPHRATQRSSSSIQNQYRTLSALEWQKLAYWKSPARLKRRHWHCSLLRRRFIHTIARSGAREHGQGADLPEASSSGA